MSLISVIVPCYNEEAAMYAGLHKCKGDYAVVMDADLQDPPSLLPEMYSYIQSGECDSVAARRITRKGEPIIRSFFARMFYKLMNRISDTDIVDGARDYRLMTRRMVDAVVSMTEYNRFSKGIFGWIGFKRNGLEYENVKRVEGETKWSFWKLFKYSLDGIMAFSITPLEITSVLGVIMSAVSGIAVLYIILRTLVFGDPVAGWPSLVCIITFMGGIQLLAIGTLGQYLAKTYLEAKRRPIYISREDNIE